MSAVRFPFKAWWCENCEFIVDANDAPECSNCGSSRVIPVTVERGDPVQPGSCPKCSSRDVTCTSDRKAHTHECHACGHMTVAAPERR